MGLFGFKKKKDVLDLTERYRRQQEKLAEIKKESESQTGNFDFLGNLASSSNSQTSESGYVNIPEEDRKKKLAKRLMDMTDKIEDLSNQIYHLQQRIEVLEKKIGTGNY